MTVTTVLTKASRIVSSLQEFMQALNVKAGPKLEVAAGENQKRNRAIRVCFPESFSLRRAIGARTYS